MARTGRFGDKTLRCKTSTVQLIDPELSQQLKARLISFLAPKEPAKVPKQTVCANAPVASRRAAAMVPQARGPVTKADVERFFARARRTDPPPQPATETAVHARTGPNPPSHAGAED